MSVLLFSITLPSASNVRAHYFTFCCVSLTLDALNVAPAKSGDQSAPKKFGNS